MVAVTDPARELVHICETLISANANSDRTEARLAEVFDVKPWSSDFYQIITCLLDRLDLLQALLAKLEMDEDVREDANRHLDGIREAFGFTSLANSWSSSSGALPRLKRHIPPVKMLSGQVRAIHPLPLLEPAEIEELTELATTYLHWLEVHELQLEDFIRQAIISGVRQFLFRLCRLQWVGSSHALVSLREVLAAYQALERESATKSPLPDMEALLMKTAAFVKSTYRTIGFAETAVDRASFLLRLYGGVGMVRDGAAVTALLTAS